MMIFINMCPAREPIKPIRYKNKVIQDIKRYKNIYLNLQFKKYFLKSPLCPQYIQLDGVQWVNYYKNSHPLNENKI